MIAYFSSAPFADIWMIIYKAPHPIYSTSIPDNVATFNTLLRLILEIHFEDRQKRYTADHSSEPPFFFQKKGGVVNKF